jgi:hypothetical protein
MKNAVATVSSSAIRLWLMSGLPVRWVSLKAGILVAPYLCT